MNELARIVEARSGSRPNACDVVTLRSRLGHDVRLMRASGYDAPIVSEHEAFNLRLEEFLTNPQFGSYLCTLTPLETFMASGVRVLPLEAIRQEIQELVPGTILFPHGCMPFATTVGGNALCFHASTGRVIWADHSSFSSDEISYMNRRTGEYEYAPFTSENIELALVPLAKDFGNFISDLLSDKLEKRIDDLDLGRI